MADIITGLFTMIVSVVLYIYISFTIRRKGPILTNTYLFATEEERKKINKEEEYRLVTVVYFCLATIFALLTVYIFTEWDWSLCVVYALCAFVFIYAIVMSIKKEI